jgi:hypothetical protein
MNSFAISPMRRIFSSLSLAEVAAQTVTNVISVEDKGMATALMEILLDGVSQRGLASTGQAGEPDDRSAMSVSHLPPDAGDRGVVPNGVA